MSEIEFVDGLIVKAPHSNAPEFVKGALSIKREELIAWLQKQKGDWVNVDIKEAKSGKWYAAVNDYKPQEGKKEPKRQEAPRRDDGPDDDIPW